MAGLQTYRSRSGQWFTGIAAALAAAMLLSLVIGGDFVAALRLVPSIATILVLVWALWWQPAVIVEDSGVTVRNVFRTIRLTWPSIERVETRWALTLYTATDKVAAWAAPAPSSLTVNRMAPSDSTHLPASTYQEDGTIRPGDLPQSASGAAALLIRERWEQLRRAGHLDDAAVEVDRPHVTWHRGTLLALAVLLVASVIAFAL